MARPPWESHPEGLRPPPHSGSVTTPGGSFLIKYKQKSKSELTPAGYLSLADNITATELYICSSLRKWRNVTGGWSDLKDCCTGLNSDAQKATHREALVHF